MQAQLTKYVTSISVFVAIIASAPLAQAMPTRLQQRLAKEMPARTVPAAERGNCANFSGHWTGTCTNDSGDTIEDWRDIEQYDCSEVSEQGDGYIDDIKVGGLKTTADASFIHNRADNMTLTADWDIARQMLTVRATGVFRDTQFDYLANFQGSATLSLVDGQLRTHSEWSGETLRNGVPTKWKGFEDCLFNKTSR